jgi:uncharacterized protein YcbX
VTDDCPVGHVTEIWRYPVKSCAGERLATTPLDATGIPGDRRLALRDVETGKIVSAKRPSLGGALLDVSATLDPERDVVTVRHGATTVTSADPEALTELFAAVVGRPVRVETSVAGGDVYESEWPAVDDVVLSDVTLDLPIALSTAKSSFVDLAALHLLTTGALREVARLLPESRVDVRRFRPSVVLDTGPDPFPEDAWVGRRGRLGTAEIEFGAASPRCIMTTVAQDDLPRDPEVLRTLAREHRIETPGLGPFACLGIYAEVVVPGTVRTGDPLVLL